MSWHEPFVVEQLFLALEISYIFAETFRLRVIIMLLEFEFMMSRRYLSSSSMAYSTCLPEQETIMYLFGIEYLLFKVALLTLILF